MHNSACVEVRKRRGGAGEIEAAVVLSQPSMRLRGHERVQRAIGAIQPCQHMRVLSVKDRGDELRNEWVVASGEGRHLAHCMMRDAIAKQRGDAHSP